MENNNEITEAEVVKEASSVSTIKAFEIEKQELQTFIDDYKNHVVSDETLDESKKIRGLIREKRYSIDRTLKHNKKVINEMKSNQEKMASELLDIITPVEERFDTGIKAIEHKKEEEKARKLKELEEKIANRTNLLYGYGMKFDGSNFVLGDITISPIQVRALEDEEFDAIKNTVSDFHKREEEKKAEAERNRKLWTERQNELNKYGPIILSVPIHELTEEKYSQILSKHKAEFEGQERLKKEEADRLEKLSKEQEAERLRLDALKKENEAKEKALKEQEEKLAKEKADKEREQLEREAKLKEEEEKLKAEKEKIRLQKIESRKQQVANLGMVTFGDSYIISEIVVSGVEFETLSDEEWNEYLDTITPLVVAEKKKIEDKRIADEAEAARRVAKEKERAAKAEAKRQEALKPNKEKLISFADKLMKIEMPELNDGSSIKILTEAAGMLTKINQYILKAVEELK